MEFKNDPIADRVSAILEDARKRGANLNGDRPAGDGSNYNRIFEALYAYLKKTETPPTAEMDEKTTTGVMFDFYKQSVYGDKELPTQQKTEVKRAFYGGVASILKFQTDVLAEMEELSAIASFEIINNEVQNFWEQEAKI